MQMAPPPPLLSILRSQDRLAREINVTVRSVAWWREGGSSTMKRKIGQAEIAELISADNRQTDRPDRFVSVGI